MEYVLQGVNCALKISNIKFFESEINLNTNALCRVDVTSGDFCGATQFNMDISQLGKFSVQIKNMYQSLYGNALLKETYGSSFVQVVATSGGHFEVSGSINLPHPHHLLEFRFDIDQTMIRDFSNKLFNDYAHFTK